MTSLTRTLAISLFFVGFANLTSPSQMAIASPWQQVSPPDVIEYDVNGLAEPPFDSFIRIITSTVSPGSWELNGGKGTISVAASAPTSRLEVSNSKEVHAELAVLFKCLRKAIRRARDATTPIALRGYWKESDATSKIRQQSQETMKFECNGLPIRQALADLARRAECEIVLAHDKLLEKLRPEDTKISMNVENNLMNILNELSNSVELGFDVVDDKIVFGKYATGKPLSIAVYPVADILESIELRTLMRGIYAKVTPGEWNSAGGMSSISVLQTRYLIVSHNTAGHIELFRHLSSLRE